VVRFEKPALFVRGIHSNYVPDDALPVIGKFFPMFQLVDIDAGHWVISEQPEAFRSGMSLLQSKDDSDIWLFSRRRILTASRLRVCMSIIYNLGILLPVLNTLLRPGDPAKTPRFLSSMQPTELT